MTLVALPEVKEVTRAEGREILEARAQRDLGIGIDEFIARLDRGDYRGSRERAVRKLIMLLPLVR